MMRQHYEEVLRVAVNAARIGIWEWDLATGRMTYSPIAREIAGFATDGEITIDMVRAITHPEDYPNTSALAHRALDPEVRENVSYRYRLIRADNQETIWVLAYGEAQFAEVDGKTVAVTYVGTIQDITEQHRAEEALAASEARLATRRRGDHSTWGNPHPDRVSPDLAGRLRALDASEGPDCSRLNRPGPTCCWRPYGYHGPEEL